MKKTLTAFGLLLSSSVMATGFYGGGQVGTSSTSLKNTYTVHYNNPPTHTEKTNDSTGASGTAYGIYGGYRFDFNNFFIASELDYNANTAVSTSCHHGIEMTYTQHPSLGINILAGLPIVDDLEIYGRIGYTQSSITAKAKNSDVFDPISKKFSGIVLGLGAQHHFDDRLSIRLDYKYIMYKEVSATILDDPLINMSYDCSVKPESHAFTIGAQYSF
ncbi:MAG: porin family protein [Candidatus Endonucleobacter bathymodioli]|uniref:Porin family protein n=1 Tax=Candidatus Endonucleibacter bathymodioli TaxID=539814 RepID=A0AA90ST79_9GAMM|nr:porin family protein [Candidatus Endonucleobacter bathymodioli]